MDEVTEIGDAVERGKDGGDGEGEGGQEKD